MELISFHRVKHGSRTIAFEENCPPTLTITLTLTLTLTRGNFPRGQLSRHLKGNEQNEVSKFSAELRKIEEKDKVMENLYAVLSNQRSSQSFADVLQKGSS